MFQDHKVAYLRENVKVKQAVPFSMLRQGVAYMLSIAAKRIPHASMTSELDVTPLVEYTRDKDKEIARNAVKMTNEILFRRAIHKNFSAFFVKAIAHAVSHVPCMNAFLDWSPVTTRGTLYHAEDINMGVTVHTKKGVVRPIVRNPHVKTLETVAAELRDLSRRARRSDPEELYRRAAIHYIMPSIRQLDVRALWPGFLLLRELLFHPYRPEPEYATVKPEDKLDATEILGATCSIANIGMVVPGHQTVTVLAPPEVMMFGLGDLHLGPRVVDGQIVVRSVMTICCTMDHRAYDAGEAFPFGDYMLKYIANPALIYEWKPGDEI